MHVEEVSFEFGQDECVFTALDNKGARHTIRCGRTDWIAGTSALGYRRELSTEMPVAAHGGWVNEHTFVMTWQYIETPFSHVLTFDFGSDEVDVSIKIVPFWQDNDEHIKGRLV
ncbi:hypothetical protein [Dictyobacter aurantiacus]|uniref:Uncharacterized protein n=1 Tax=Dictyobacter aurantiacus TaxID=1936993 RepID=A0A401ZLD7_9CHLR|nr:hypothetical protein [Dictyobacter aurantiacus]GCE07656.1 hypothetical protein KDAU_49850 [Dictyobacter aurantiacus]